MKRIMVIRNLVISAGEEDAQGKFLDSNSPTLEHSHRLTTSSGSELKERENATNLSHRRPCFKVSVEVCIVFLIILRT